MKEYKRWGLPLPPPEAQLVRAERNPLQPGYWVLAFRWEPVKPGEPVRYWFGRSLFEAGTLGKIVPLREPTPRDLETVDEYWTDWLGLAVAFKLRGWNEAATTAHAKARAQDAAYQKNPDVTPSSLLATVRWWAWVYWDSKLTEHTSDRREILSKL